jgi:hypothetical protein
MIAVLLAAAVMGQVEFEGSLKEALKKVAREGNLNVVVAGDLNEPVQVQLNNDLKPEEALEALAKVYQLDVQKQGKLWVVRRASSPPAVAPPVPPVAPVEPAAPVAPAPPEVEYKEMGDLVSTGDIRLKTGQEADSVVSYGGDVIIERGALVSDSAVSMGGDVIVEGLVAGDAVAMGGEVILKGDGEVTGDKVTMGRAGVRALTGSNGPRHLKMPKMRKVHVNIDSDDDDDHDDDKDDDDAKVSAVTASNDKADGDDSSSGGFTWATFLARFAALFGLGFLMTVFAPQRLKALESVVRQEPVKNGLAGLLGLVAFVPLVVLLAVTLVGIPVALVLCLVAPLAALLGVVVMANTVGTALPTGRLKRTQAVVLAVGLLAVLVAAQLPVVGPISFGVLMLIGLGAVIRTRAGSPRLTQSGMPVNVPVAPF